jgi:hypothetical protein
MNIIKIEEAAVMAGVFCFSLSALLTILRKGFAATLCFCVGIVTAFIVIAVAVQQ